jgi:hypothetical protein
MRGNFGTQKLVPAVTVAGQFALGSYKPRHTISIRKFNEEIGGRGGTLLALLCASFNRNN